jgi:hypothetical protein
VAFSVGGAAKGSKKTGREIIRKKRPMLHFYVTSTTLPDQKHQPSMPAQKIANANYKPARAE